MRKEKEIRDMTPEQEEFIRLLRDKAEDTPIPMAMEPSMMMARLETKAAKKKTPWLKVLSPVALAVTACFVMVLAGRSGDLNATIPAVPTSSQTEISSELPVSDVSEPSSEQSDTDASIPDESGEVSEESGGPAGGAEPSDNSGPSVSDGAVSSGITAGTSDGSAPTVSEPGEPDDVGEQPSSPVEEEPAGETPVESITSGYTASVTYSGVSSYSPRDAIDNPYSAIYSAMQEAATPENAMGRYATSVLSAGISTDGLQIKDEKAIICSSDGYFYISRQNSNEVTIVSADGFHEFFTVEFETPSFDGLTVDSYAITHCEVANGRLFVAGTVSYTCDGVAARTVSAMSCYDLTYPDDPHLIAKSAQDGTMIGFREKDGYLYLFSRYYPDSAAPENYPEAYIPFRYTEDGVEIVSADEIVISSCREESYIVATAYSSKEPGSGCGSLVLQGGGRNYYLSNESLYLFGEDYENGEIMTQISALRCQKGGITLSGEVSVPGILNSTNSPDEYAGTLRILTNSYGTSNDTNLYIFDRQLNLLGSKEGLVENKILRSVRFERSKLYFSLYEDRTVTYALDLLIPQDLGEPYKAERSEEALQVAAVDGERTLRLSGALGRSSLTMTLKKGRELFDTVTIPLTGTYSENSIGLQIYEQGRWAAVSYTDSGAQKQVIRFYAIEENTLREVLTYECSTWYGSVRAYLQNGRFYVVSIAETAVFDVDSGKQILDVQY